MIPLSDMRNRITFKKAAASMDATGNRTNAYADYCTRWAYVNKVSGAETFDAGKTNEEETLKFVVRFDSQTKLITPGSYRISFSGKTYDIKSVDNYKMRNESLTITAKEI